MNDVLVTKMGVAFEIKGGRNAHFLRVNHLIDQLEAEVGEKLFFRIKSHGAVFDHQDSPTDTLKGSIFFERPITVDQLKAALAEVTG